MHTPTVIVSTDTQLRAAAQTYMPLTVFTLGSEATQTNLFLGPSPFVED
jgi:hypothetical protein